MCTKFKEILNQNKPKLENSYQNVSPSKPTCISV